MNAEINKFIRREIQQEGSLDFITAGVMNVFGKSKLFATAAIANVQMQVAEEAEAAGEFPIADTPSEKCPKCGAAVEYDFEPSFQEYAGASPQPASHSWDCTNEDCDYHKSETGDCIQGQENKRSF